jgi:CheY-like chemotaxis protein
MEEILLIEDDDDIRESLTDLLQGRGYSVTGVTNGRDALARLASGPAPCLIMLDLMLPIMDGWEFRAQQIANPAWEKIPVVVVSGVPNAQQQALKLKAAAFLGKPIELDRLYRTIEQHC